MVKKSAKSVETTSAESVEGAPVVTAECASVVSDDIKVVILTKGTGGTIGVQAKDCDPALEIFEGGLDVALERIPGFVEEAKARWAESKLNPKCESELPSQKVKPPLVSTQPPSRRRTGPQQGQMERMF